MLLKHNVMASVGLVVSRIDEKPESSSADEHGFGQKRRRAFGQGHPQRLHLAAHRDALRPGKQRPHLGEQVLLFFLTGVVREDFLQHRQLGDDVDAAGLVACAAVTVTVTVTSRRRLRLTGTAARRRQPRRGCGRG